MIQGFLKTTYTQPRKTGQLHGWNVDPIDVNHQEPGYCWHVLTITKVKFLSSWMEGWLQGTLGKNRLLLFQDSRPLLSCSFQASLSVLFIRGHATHLLVTSAKQRLTDKTFSCSTRVGVDSKDFRSSYSMLQTLYSCTPNYTREWISWLFWCSDCKGKQVVPQVFMSCSGCGTSFAFVLPGNKQFCLWASRVQLRRCAGSSMQFVEWFA